MLYILKGLKLPRSRVLHRRICYGVMGVSAPSLHRESTDYDIRVILLCQHLSQAATFDKFCHGSELISGRFSVALNRPRNEATERPALHY